MIDWQIVIIAAIVATPGVLTGLAALIVSIRTHKAVNSRMDEFKRLFEESFVARGELKEKNAEEDRKAVIAAMKPVEPVQVAIAGGAGVDTPLKTVTEKAKP